MSPLSPLNFGITWEQRIPSKFLIEIYVSSSYSMSIVPLTIVIEETTQFTNFEVEGKFLPTEI